MAANLGTRTERAKEMIKGAVAPDAAAMQANGTATAPIGTSDNPSHAVFTIANVITFTRLVLTFVFLGIFVQQDPSTRALAIMLYAIAAISDFLDGQIARRTQTVSWVGKVMDPIMDRVLLLTGVLGLMITGELPIWIAAIVLTRDAYILGAAMYLRRFETRPIDVIFIGKAATALLMTGYGFLLIGHPQVQGFNWVDVPWLPGFNGQTCAASIYLVYAGMICSVVSAIIYRHTGRKIKRAVLERRKELESQQER